MGSMTEPLPYGELVENNRELIGNFMNPPDARARMLAMVAPGTLSLEPVAVQAYPLAHLPAAMDAAARMRGLDMAVVAMT